MMAELWRQQPIEVYQGWLEAIESEASDKLNDWETQFIGSMQTKLLKGHNLTEFQAKKLEEVYVKYTS
jgi:hypothetical protein